MSLRLTKLISVVWLASAMPGLGAGSDWAQKVFKYSDKCLDEKEKFYYDMESQSIIYKNLPLEPYIQKLNKRTVFGCSGYQGEPFAEIKDSGIIFGSNYTSVQIPLYPFNVNNCMSLYYYHFRINDSSTNIMRNFQIYTGKKIRIYSSVKDRIDDESAESWYIVDEKPQPVLACYMSEEN